MGLFGAAIKRDVKLYVLTLFLFSVLALFTHNMVIAALASLLVSYGYSKIFVRRFLNSLVAGLIFGLIIQMGWIMFVSVLFWVFRISIDLSWLVVIANFVGLTASYAVSRGYRTSLLTHSGFVDIGDAWALVAVAIFFGAYLFGAITHMDRNRLDIEVVQMTSNALDDQSHFNLFRDTLLANKGLLIGDRDNPLTGNESGYSPYPRGAHLPAAALADTARSGWADGDRNNTGAYDEIKAYLFFKLFYFALLIFMLSRLGAYLIDELKAGNHQKKFSAIQNKLLYLVPIALSTLLTFGYLIEFIPSGFFSFMPVMFLVSLFLLILSDLSRKYTSKSEPLTLFLLAIVASFTFLTWTIVGIVMYVYILFVLIKLLLERGFKPAVNALLVVAPLLLIGVFQMYIQLFSEVPSPSVNTPGGIVGYSPFLLAFLLVAACWTFVTQVANTSAPLFKASFLLALLFIPVGFLIALANIAVHGSLQYFFIKTMYVPFSVLMLLATTPLSILLLNTWGKGYFEIQQLKAPSFYKHLYDVVFVCLLLGAFIFIPFIAFLPGRASLAHIIKNSAAIDGKSAHLVLDSLHEKNRPDDTVDVVLEELKNQGQNINILHTMRSGNNYNYCQTLIFDRVYFTNGPPITGAILEECKRTGITVINLWAPDSIVKSIDFVPSDVTLNIHET